MYFLNIFCLVLIVNCYVWGEGIHYITAAHLWTWEDGNSAKPFSLGNPEYWSWLARTSESSALHYGWLVAVISWWTTRCHCKLNAQYSIQCYLWALSLTWKVPAIILCRLWHQSMLIGSCYNICMTNDDKAPIGEVPASLLKVPARYHTML